MFLQTIVSVFNLEYNFAQYLVLKGLAKVNIRVTEKEKNALIDRVYRLRFDVKILLSLLWLAVLLIGLPLKIQIWNLEMQLWDLEFQICILKFLSTIFQFIAYFRGLLEGIFLGLAIASIKQQCNNWLNLQKEKAKVYYLIYKCKNA